MRKSTGGFTIVELLIVIVVIAILAVITVVAYSGIQQRGRDVQRKSDLAAIEKAIKLWSTSTGKSFADINAGYLTTGMGWFDGQYTSPTSLKQLLVSSGFLSSGVQDPINTKVVGASSFAYMVSECTTGDSTRRVVLAQLEMAPAETLIQQLGTTCNSTTYNDYTANYKMNYGRLVQLQP